MSLKKRPPLLRSRRTTSTMPARAPAPRRSRHSSSKASPPHPSRHGVVQGEEDLAPEPLPAGASLIREEEGASLNTKEEEEASLSTKGRREGEETLAEESESIRFCVLVNEIDPC
jgi:hypothetical protein